MRALIEAHGRAPVAMAVREVLAALRVEITAGTRPDTTEGAIMARLAGRVATALAPTLGPVFNLTGTVLHTNLGRASLAPEALAAIAATAAGPANLEFDLATGRRGDRDDHLAGWLCRLTGAEAATVVNNNAAAVLLALNTLARRKEVPVSRGELIEIGGAFRMPDIMARAGAKLREVGTTNRTHVGDYAAALGARTALLLKVHTSNYAIEGFTATVPERELASLAHAHGLPLMVDLGSGALVDLARWGLPREPTVQDTLAAGADIVTFSGDKLLGGPQAGLIVGREDLVARLNRNPMKRAVRVDRMTVAALAATLRLYADPDRLPGRLPALRLLARPTTEIRATADRIRPALAEQLAGQATVRVVDCQSQVGSGARPLDLLESAALAIEPTGGARGRGRRLARLAAAFLALPIPVIGRLRDEALVLDLRCLEDESGFVAQLDELVLGRVVPQRTSS